MIQQKVSAIVLRMQYMFATGDTGVHKFDPFSALKELQSSENVFLYGTEPAPHSTLSWFRFKASLSHFSQNTYSS